MDVFGTLATQFGRFWTQSSVAGRVVTIGGIVAMLLTVIGTAIWSSQPDYKLLRENISPVLTAEIKSVLETNGIPAQLNYAGTGIKVPASRWNEANVAISGIAGGGGGGKTAAPAGSSGGSLFQPAPNHGSLLRSKELSVKRSLERLHFVKSADVHIAMPEPSNFRRQQQPTTASVIITSHDGAVISQDSAAGIVQLVASAVEGLDPKNVTLTSSDGQLAGQIGKDDPATQRRQYVQHLESVLAMKAQDVLAATLGPNRSVVRVTAVVDDFLEKTITENKIMSDSKVRLVEKITSSDQKGMKATSGGVSGAAGNGLAATTNAAASTNTPISGKTETNETTYDYPRIEQTSREVGGQLLRLSVSASVDVTVDTNDGAGGVTTAEKLTKEQVEKLIRVAVGYDQARGDQLEVVLTEFYDAPIATATTDIPDTQKWEFVTQLARHASLGLAAVVALLIGMMTLKKMQPIEVATSSATDTRRRELLTELSNRVDQNPEAVSRILAAWLSQDADGSLPNSDVPMKKAA